MTAASSAPASERSISRTIEPGVSEDWPGHGLGPVAEILALLPDPAELAPGARVAVLAGSPERGLFARLFSSSSPRAKVHLAVRCTALLLRGYASISADEAGVAYGVVPP